MFYTVMNKIHWVHRLQSDDGEKQFCFFNELQFVVTINSRKRRAWENNSECVSTLVRVLEKISLGE